MTVPIPLAPAALRRSGQARHRCRDGRDGRDGRDLRGRLRRAVAAALLGAVLVGCGTRATDPSATDTVDDRSSASAAPSPTVEEVPADPEDAAPEPARVARPGGHLEVFEAPGSGTASQVLAPVTGFDSPTVLLVTGQRGEWLEVLLPVRPNGTTGWIRADAVEVTSVDLAVVVDLATRELRVLDAGEEVLTTPVAIGDAQHPTPPGTFFVTDKLDTGDPDGPYGPFALGLSARSDVLTEFAGGDGQVGIHGTDAPSSIGRAASHGCIRVPNDVIAELAHLLPLGTPVTVW
ncbi:L,D-transpeptidase [Egicoccus sp. AB-alg2]|uniref:L,D-transpeptidase n=1 Tax=Egicoccus sp. AB-alg2 TaxID=3242693 RepID=UPI00359DF92F